MESSKRRFLKVAGLSAAGIAAFPAIKGFTSSGEKHSDATTPKIYKNPDALMAKRWAMVIDMRKLESEEQVEPIIEACHKIHNVPHIPTKHHEIKWIWATEYKHAFPSLGHKHIGKKLNHLPFLVLCNHCEDPPCVRACPTQATFKREDGIVLMDFHRCIGCRFCMAACPYGSRSFNFQDPRTFLKETDNKFPTRMKGVVEKCNFCAERLAQGKPPACVEASDGAIVFGDLDDSNSDVCKLLESNHSIRRKEGLGTGPSVFYIL